MTTVLPPDAGPSLDRRIGRLLEGVRRPLEAPAYSTDDGVAQELATRLEGRGISPVLEEDSGSWYCVFWAARSGDEVKERVASGSADTRALAICRAVLNLPLTGTGTRLRLRTASRGWIEPETPRPAPRGEPQAEVVSGDEGLPEPTRAARGF